MYINRDNSRLDSVLLDILYNTDTYSVGVPEPCRKSHLRMLCTNQAAGLYIAYICTEWTDEIQAVSIEANTEKMANINCFNGRTYLFFGPQCR